jgi:predicted glycosyltransferase
MIGTSAEIAHVGFALRIPNIFVNEDDVAVVPLVGKVIHPFAKHLLAPDVCDTGAPEKTIRYNGYHELAYLHPELFKADRNIADKYVEPGKRYFLLRFAKLTAHHDTGIRGIDARIAARLVQMLKPYGNIYITSERELEKEFEPYRLPIRSADMHHVLAFSSIYIGDSQTMAAEAGCLGVPFIRCNDFVGRIGYLKDLEDNFKLGYGIKPSEEEKLYKTLQSMLDNQNLAGEWKTKLHRMLDEKIETASFITNLIENYPASLRNKI